MMLDKSDLDMSGKRHGWTTPLNKYVADQCGAMRSRYPTQSWFAHCLSSSRSSSGRIVSMLPRRSNVLKLHGFTDDEFIRDEFSIRDMNLPQVPVCEIGLPYNRLYSEISTGAQVPERQRKQARQDEGWLGTLKQVIVPILVGLARLKQVIVPILVGLAGLVCMGLLLSIVTQWDNFKCVPSLITLIPPLLGLKGNIQMKIIARLRTDCHTCVSRSKQCLVMRLKENLALMLFQAAIWSLMVVLLILSARVIFFSTPSWHECVIVVSSAVVTAAADCLLLGVSSWATFYACARHHIDPDIVPPLLTEYLGDISTLGLFYGISLASFHLSSTRPCVPIAMTLVVIVASLYWSYVVFNSKLLYDRLRDGWWVKLTSIVLSVIAGQILNCLDNLAPKLAVIAATSMTSSVTSLAYLVAKSRNGQRRS